MSRDFTNEALFAAAGPLTEFGPPEIIDLEPIHTCNFRCVMCHVSQEHLTHVAVDIEALRRSISSLPLKGRWACVGATHEPCMHPQFDDIVAILTEAGMNIDLTTNGSLFTDKLIDKIKGGRFARVTVSFDGATKATYERIRRNADFERTLDRVLAFKDAVGNASTFWAVNYTVTRTNVDEILPAVRLWEDMGFDQIGFISMVQRSGAPEVMSEVMDDAAVDRMKANLNVAARMVIAERLRIGVGSSTYHASPGALEWPDNFEGPVVRSSNPASVDAENCRPFFQNGYYPDVNVACRSPYKAVRISYDGAVMMCFDKFAVGNINSATLADIWYGEAATAKRTSIKADVGICHDCDFYKFCIQGGTVDAGDAINRVTHGGTR